MQIFNGSVISRDLIIFLITFLVGLWSSGVVFRVAIRLYNTLLVRGRHAQTLVLEPTVLNGMGIVLYCLVANFMITVVAYQFTSNSLATIESAEPYFPYIWIAFGVLGSIVLSAILSLLLPARFKHAFGLLFCSYIPSVLAGIVSFLVSYGVISLVFYFISNVVS
ncbi:MAG: hypothetical protein KDA70_15875 [Planctomycetaceae bacterium]|nr:hypothetical protein [Planctomycetaceae bacterium]MCA9021846.1 hypothetical protein [Planctomycetaceae bacterium]